MHNQRTLKKEIQCTGVGVHSGRPVTINLIPAPADQGVVFVRTDLSGRPRIKANPDNVASSFLATTLARNGAQVATAEHLLAALAGSGVDNLTVEVNGPELPIMDGSAAPFLLMINAVGTRKLEACREVIKINRPVKVSSQDRTLEVEPSEKAQISCAIEFDHPLLKRQELSLELNEPVFGAEISRARTFGFLEDADRLRAAGLARGVSLDNAIVIDRFKIMNQGGLRFEDEFVRHKMLDLIGDLALLGRPILGHFKAYKTGHALNHAFLREMAASPDCWELVHLAPPAPQARAEAYSLNLRGMPEPSLA